MRWRWHQTSSCERRADSTTLWFIHFINSLIQRRLRPERPGPPPLHRGPSLLHHLIECKMMTESDERKSRGRGKFKRKTRARCRERNSVRFVWFYFSFYHLTHAPNSLRLHSCCWWHRVRCVCVRAPESARFNYGPGDVGRKTLDYLWEFRNAASSRPLAPHSRFCHLMLLVPNRQQQQTKFEWSCVVRLNNNNDKRKKGETGNN